MRSCEPLSCGEPGRGSSASEASFDPPQTQTGKPAQAHGGQRCPKINPDDLGLPIVAHQSLEGMQRTLELLVGPGATAQHVMTVAIAGRQRIAALAVVQDESALEVDRPHVIGLRRHGQAIVARVIDPWRAPPPHTQPDDEESHRWCFGPAAPRGHVSSARSGGTYSAPTCDAADVPRGSAPRPFRPCGADTRALGGYAVAALSGPAAHRAPSACRQSCG